MNYVIAVDLGTTSTKAVAFGTDGSVLSSRSVSYPILSPKPNWSEQKPQLIFEAMLDTIRAIVRKQKKAGHKLVGVGFSSAMHGLMAADQSGHNLTNCMIWADSRSQQQALKLRSTKEGLRIYRKTGTPIHPMSPLCKLLWIRQNNRSLLRSAAKFISPKEYIFKKLFGEYWIDYSIASATGLFDIFALKWDAQALKLAGIDPTQLSSPVSPLSIHVGLNKHYAEQMNIDRDVPFVIGASDGCLANLGSGAIRPGAAAVTIGTSGAIRVISAKPKTDPKQRIFSYLLTPEHYALGGAINNGGIALSWFLGDFYGTQPKSEIYTQYFKKAQRIPAGAEGLICLPYLLGERAPHWNANARGVFFGVHISHTRDHFFRALLEGIILSLYDVSQALESIVCPVDRIYPTGVIARNPFWLQMLADVFGKKVLVPDAFESSCMGAAILAMRALNIIPRIENVEQMVHIKKRIEPNGSLHKKYRAHYQLFKELYTRLESMFPNIAALT
ncbi:MAG: gluconokinase [Deltaproteobacteria bacterium]|nr:gluconokinase [Deltaproteobacteria bacterium]